MRTSRMLVLLGAAVLALTTARCQCGGKECPCSFLGYCELECNGSCAPYPFNTDTNCGDCGHACGNDKYCSNAICKPFISNLHCGTRAHACSQTESCDAGVCIACPDSLISCDEFSACNKNSSTDNENCGSCGNRCPILDLNVSAERTSCNAGVCAPCPLPKVNCVNVGVCVDPYTDPIYCGAHIENGACVFTNCIGGMSSCFRCNNGTCEAYCPPGQSCVDAGAYQVCN